MGRPARRGRTRLGRPGPTAAGVRLRLAGAVVPVSRPLPSSAPAADAPPPAPRLRPTTPQARATPSETRSPPLRRRPHPRLIPVGSRAALATRLPVVLRSASIQPPVRLDFLGERLSDLGFRCVAKRNLGQFVHQEPPGFARSTSKLDTFLPICAPHPVSRTASYPLPIPCRSGSTPCRPARPTRPVGLPTRSSRCPTDPRFSRPPAPGRTSSTPARDLRLLIAIDLVLRFRDRASEDA